MHALIKRLPLLILLAVLVPCAPSGAPADEAPTEIRLGKAPPPAPKPDPAYARAVERFLAARQTASMDRSREAAARKWLTAAAKVDAATLAGGPGQVLVAFDFTDAAMQRLEGGRFRVPAYLLFADRQGRIVESRDEVLTFTGGPGTLLCTSLQTAGVMGWDLGEVEKSADQLKSREALDRADEFLKAWVKQQKRSAAYSIEDIYPAGKGRIMIPCLKFSAEFGRRGYDVVDSPLIMRRGPNGFQLEPTPN